MTCCSRGDSVSKRCRIRETSASTVRRRRSRSIAAITASKKPTPYDGQSGRDRLRIVSALSRSAKNELFDRIGLRAGMVCLDVGCGGGEVTCELAKRVGTTGKAIGLVGSA